MRIRTVAVPLLAIALLSSCASICTGSEDSVEILSDPPGAEFETNTGHKGTTPSTITIPDKVDLRVTMRKEGYQEAHAQSESRLSAWLFGNILIGGVIGFVIDFATGNYQTHDDVLSVTLTPIGAAPAVPATPPGG